MKPQAPSAPAPARPLRTPILVEFLSQVAREPRRVRPLLYGRLDRLRRRSRPDDRRFEFEKLYAENPDPWSYRDNPYEARKYEHTLAAARQLRPDARAVLELACSIGVFTRQLAEAFPEVTAVDVAGEALRLARRRVGGVGRVRYARGDIRRLRLRRSYDLIFCAEVLYYIPEPESPGVLAMLEHHLAPGGVLVTTMPTRFRGRPVESTLFWDRTFVDAGLEPVSEEAFQHHGHQYVIRGYRRGPAAFPEPSSSPAAAR